MKEKLEKIGQVGKIQVGGLEVEVKTLDYKFSWGRDRWLVEPISGQGQVWSEQVIFTV